MRWARDEEEARSSEDLRGARARDERGVRWPAEEEARVRVELVTTCARDEARLGWSPGGGGAAGSDRSGGEHEATEKKAWRLLDPVGEEGGGNIEEEN